MKISLAPLYAFAGGLSEFWALVFGASGIVLAFRSHLDGNFAAFIVSVQGLLVAHDSIDDYLQHKKEQTNGAQNSNPAGAGPVQK